MCGLVEATQKNGKVCWALGIQPQRDIIKSRKSAADGATKTSKLFPVMDALNTKLLFVCSSALPADQLEPSTQAAVNQLRAIRTTAANWSPHPILSLLLSVCANQAEMFAVGPSLSKPLEQYNKAVHNMTLKLHVGEEDRPNAGASSTPIADQPLSRIRGYESMTEDDKVLVSVQHALQPQALSLRGHPGHLDALRGHLNQFGGVCARWGVLGAWTNLGRNATESSDVPSRPHPPSTRCSWLTRLDSPLLSVTKLAQSVSSR
ncbi:hypothetical protein PtA15_3A425 [Puccinia triticina]|uniref:Uncharacterized protein n=1 Tax=Puccinia triticina TaxID=208348 RepID=A0ABY7CDQ7_9BASI|nr:uncharacterized protein PtA15_3A425 [Puccinia triticina]WAQ83058.1 hypothetical protein PtA15_3A425 [Puccinia triticina]